MKLAINHYGRFESSKLDLFMNEGQTFIVTPEIEESKQFQTGLARQKFEVIEVTDLADVQRAVNVTDEVLEEFREQLTTDPEPEDEAPPAEPEVPSEVPEDGTSADIPVDETPPEEPPAEPEAPPAGEHPPPEEEGDQTEEPPNEDENADEGAGEDSGEGEGEQDPVLPFTEAAGNVDKALAAIAKETDIERLQFALEHDDRVSLRPAIEARIKELQG